MAQETWSEYCLITINMIGDATNYEFAALTETVDIPIGNKDFEGIVNVGGGRLKKFMPEEEATIEFEMYPVEAGFKDAVTTAEGVVNLFHPQANASVAGEMVLPANHARQRTRIAILWSEQIFDGTTPATTAVGDMEGDSYQAIRFVAAEGHIIGIKPTFTDKVLKFTVTYKFMPFDKYASENYKWESTSGQAAGADVAALGEYLTTAKWA